MTTKKYLGLGLLIATAVVGCAGQTGGAELLAVNVPIYRGVDANNNGRATLSPSQFRFNPDLSTFDNPASAPVLKDCNYMFTAVGIPSPVAVGASGPVQGLPGYVASFDNTPPGHWGIWPPAGTPPAMAASAVATYAQGARGNVVNGTRNNCS